MRRAMTGPCRPVADSETGDDVADPAIAVAQLRWRLATYRRIALRGVAECVARISALRLRLNEPALDTLLAGFRSIRDELEAMDPQGAIALEKVEALSRRLIALQNDLGRYAADGAAAAGPA